MTNDTYVPDANEVLTITSVTVPVCTDGRDDSVNNTSAAVTFTANNVQFTATQFFWGICSFNYTISDGNGGVDTAAVAVTVINGISISSNMCTIVTLALYSE